MPTPLALTSHVCRGLALAIHVPFPARRLCDVSSSFRFTVLLLPHGLSTDPQILAAVHRWASDRPSVCCCTYKPRCTGVLVWQAGGQGRTAQ